VDEGGVRARLEDEDTQAQLSDVRYMETPGGLIEIEHKDEARAGVRRPRPRGSRGDGVSPAKSRLFDEKYRFT
jgi:hypothetical protein